jgi:serine/threonine protein kinase
MSVLDRAGRWHPAIVPWYNWVIQPPLSSVATANAIPRYLAPELQGSAGKLGKVEFLRCDVWALGLLCWEVLRNGYRYYELDSIQALFLKSGRNCSSGGDLSASREPETQMSNGSLQERMFTLCPDLARLAQLSVDELRIYANCSLRKNMVKGILRNTLQVDPQRRPHDLSRLPFIFGGGLYAGYAMDILSKFLRASDYLDGPSRTIWKLRLSKGHLLKINGCIRFVARLV